MPSRATQNYPVFFLLIIVPDLFKFQFFEKFYKKKSFLALNYVYYHKIPMWNPRMPTWVPYENLAQFLLGSMCFDIQAHKTSRNLTDNYFEII